MLNVSLAANIRFMFRPPYTRVQNSGTHWIRGCMGVRAGLDGVEMRKNSAGNRTLAVQPVAKQRAHVD
jgi:hypothetical protein